MIISKTFVWSAAHKLELPYKSQCEKLHGHSYEVRVCVEGPINENGMVMDFSVLKDTINKYGFDHSYLNDFMNDNPTAENLVIFMKGMILNTHCLPKTVKLKSVRVWETPTSFAEETW